MPGLFDAPGVDPRYTALKNAASGPLGIARAQIEGYWATGQLYLDDDLPIKAARCFPPCFWELYLTAALLDGGSQLEPRSQRKSKSKGPDLKLAGQPIWIEAVSATSGLGQDRVSKPVDKEAYRVPDDQIKLRLRNALDSKRDAHTRYLETGFLVPADVFVVAINAGDIPWACQDTRIPRIVRSLFPFGAEEVALDPINLEVIGRRIGFQDRVLKLSGAPVSTDCFLSPEYAGVSALLYACADEANHGQLLLVHNPKATAPLARALLPCAFEFWYDASSHSVRVEEAPTVLEES